MRALLSYISPDAGVGAMAPEDTFQPQLTGRFQEALVYATTIHASQMRKGTAIPYGAHLLAVAASVLENGGGEDVAIAALLHDAVEDQGGKARLEDIRHRFGDHVARIVEGCTDADEEPKPPWRGRKERYLEHLRQCPADVRLVALADKLHNARAILRDYRTVGDKVWDRFSADRIAILWYYRSLVRVFEETGSNGMVQEFDRVVSELEQVAGMAALREDRR